MPAVHLAPAASADRRPVVLAGALLVAAVALAYANGLSGPFVYDDKTSILYNGSIRHLWPLTNFLHPPGNGATVSGRPVLNLSFALDYAFGGLQVGVYHVTNVLIHAAAALTLFGLIRRTLLRPVMAPRLREAATPAAFCLALVWALHPLHTEAVTYLAQRAESLMSLFYLLALYCFVRSVDETGGRQEARGESNDQPHAAFAVAAVGDCGRSASATAPAGCELAHFAGSGPRGARERAPSTPASRLSPLASRLNFWPALSFLACLAGMATKENMVTAPIVVFLYDRAFVAGTIAAAWRARRRFHLALLATWIPLAALVISTGGDRGGSAGLDVGVSFLAYALTQFPALVHYAVLSAWPHPLAFDYGPFFITHVAEVAAPALLVIGAVAASCYALWRHPKIGFLTAVVFGILAPTSLVPGTTQMIVEHRMYLPLAALLCLLAPLAALPGRKLLGAAAVAAALALGLTTAARNRVYRSELSLWADTVAKRPDSAIAHSSYGAALRDAGHPAAAVAEHRRALAINPDYVPALANLGLALTEAGNPEQALPMLVHAVQRDPQNPQAHLNLGVTLDLLHRGSEALPHYAAAVRLNPLLPAAQNDYGDALSRAGRLDEGIAHLRRALALDPDYAEADFNLAAAQVRQGRLGAAQATFARGAALRPGDASAHVTWANFLLRQGHPAEAFAEYRAALRLQPGSADAHYSYATALAGAGRYGPALAEFEAAVKARPDYAEAYNNLGNTFSALNRFPEAVTAYQKAVQLRPNDASTHNNLGLALARSGRLREATAQFQAAVRLAPGFENARSNLEHAEAELGE